MRCRTFAGCVLALIVLAAPVDAEQLITMELEPPFIAGQEKAANQTYTIWVGEAKVREDRPERSVIVDRSAGKMFVLRHDDKTFHALDLPINFESMVPPELLEQWRTVLRARKTEVAIQPTEETGTVGPYQVKKYEAAIRNAMGGTMNLTLWNTDTIGFDVEAYKALMLEIAALQPGSDDWIRKLFEIDGYPVRMVRTFDTPQGKLISTEQLLSVEEKTAPAGLWKPTPGYTEVEFSLLSAAPE